MKFKIVLLLTFICLISYDSVFAQNQVNPVEYEVGVIVSAGSLSKIKGSVTVLDSTITFGINDKIKKLLLVKKSNKYFFSEGNDNFIFTINEQKGKIEDFEYNCIGVLETKGKLETNLWYLNKK